MKIFVACSKYFYDKIPNIKKEMEKNGHELNLPNSFEEPMAEEIIKNIGGDAHIKWKSEMMKKDENNISPNDAILVLNFEKNGIINYIGGATFLEVYTAWKLNKKIYFYNPLPECIFKDELIGINPIILNGDLSKIK